MKKIIGIGIGLLIGILIGYGIRGLSISGPENITIKFKNNSGEKISILKIVAEEGEYRFQNIANGDLRAIRFFPEGETHFDIIAQFMNNKATSYYTGYAERGYTFTAGFSNKILQVKQE